MNSFTAQISVSGGTAPYTIDAGGLGVTDNGDGTYDIAGIADNTATSVQITDAQNCAIQLNIPALDCVCPVIAPPANPAGNFYCFGETPSALLVDDPGAGFEVNWYNSPIGGASLGNGITYTPAASGTYYAEVTELVNGCVSTRIPVVLTETPQILVIQGIHTCSTDLLTYDVDITVSGGTAPYTVNAGAATITDNGGGSYTVAGIASNTAATVNITDANGCIVSTGLNPVNCSCPPIAPPANPINAFVCFGQSLVSLSVDDPGAGLTVNWYDAPVGGTMVGTGTSYTPSTPGTYYAEIEDISGCNSTRVPVALTQGADLNIVQIDGYCSADLNTYNVNLLISNTSGLVTATATDDGGVSYVVSDMGGGAYLVQDLPSNGTGIITVTVTDATNCVETLVIGPVPCNCPVITPPANPADAFVCFGDAPVALCVDNPGAGFTIEWYDAASGGALLGTGSCFTPTVAGTFYALAVEDVNACISTTVAVTLSQGTAINISQTPGTCAPDLLTFEVPVTVTGGTAPYTVAAGAATVTDNGGGSYTISGIPNTTSITVSITDADGCSQTLALASLNCSCATTPEPANPADAFICAGDAPVALSVSNPGAGYVINWYDSPVGGVLLGTGTTYTPLTPGTYYAETEEVATGCFSARVPVTLSQGTSISITDAGAACSADLLTYDVTVSVTGGTEPYTFDAGGYTVTPILDAWIIEDITSGTSVVLNVTDADGCPASLDLGVTTCNCAVVAPPANPVNSAYCQGATPTSLSVDSPGAGFVVQWYDVPAGGTPVATGNSFTPPAAGTYYAEILETATDCVSNRIAVTLTMTSLPPAPVAASPNPYCEGAVINALGATGTGGTLTWYSDAALTTQVGTGATLNPVAPTAGNSVSYWVAETLNGCQGPATEVTVSVIVCNCITPDPPVLDITGQTVCEGDPIAAFNATAAAGLEIRWYFGGALVGTGVSFTPTQAGTYTLTAFDTAEGCESAPVTAALIILSTPVANFSLPDNTCLGDAVSIAFTGTASATAVYLWDFGADATPATATGSAPQSVSWNTAGIKTVTLTIDDNGCIHTLSLPIAVSDVTASISPDNSFIDQGQSVVLEVSATSALGTVLSYEWIPDTGCPDCASVTVTPTGSVNTYTVIVSDEYGCTETVLATVNVIARNEVVIPNAFSPNGDGMNDIFRLTGFNVSEVKLHVYNRWGNEVYFNVSSSLTDGWNGEYKGKQQEIGVYVYYATVTFTDGTTETLKGNVTLIK
ncbi:MAG: gliding motility-associated C-terminal domain-containing protein [Sphingobacteriales bacterium]|nr:MAG: gliding motility-associated C-terminal domain-containing protein [Sphingobacteriales bacterium]